MTRKLLLMSVCCALTATAAAVDAAKSVAKADEVPTKEAIDRALADLFAERESWGNAPAGGQASASGLDVAGVTAEATGDLEGFLALRQTWGTGPAPKTVKAPLAKGAPANFAAGTAAAPSGPSAETIVQPEVERPLPKLALDSQADIVRARNALLKERESWGTEPSKSTADPSSTAATGGTGDLTVLLAERESWGTGPDVETVKPPLAKGATAKLEFPKAVVAGDAKPPIVHELEARPIPKVADIAPDKIRQAMGDLLSEREGWGTEPSASTAMATATGGTGDLAALLGEREGWGTGPDVKTVKPPLAKGATAKLEFPKAVVAGDAKPPIVHELEARPIPKVADIAPDKIRQVMSDLLSEREGWGTEPSAGTTQAAAATGGTGDLAALLSEREGWGTGPSQTVAAAGTDTAARRDACSEDLRRLASERRIFFRSASAKLQPQSNEALQLIAKTIKDCGKVAILIEGHTDSIGPSEANQALSEARALSVLEFLATAGIERARLEAIGHGETKPVASNATSRERALNRRIEFSIR